MFDILCSGPGPHEPASGILGESDREQSGMRCPLCSALADADQPASTLAPQPLVVDPATVAALVTQTSAATTIDEVKDALLATFAAIAGQTGVR